MICPDWQYPHCGTSISIQACCRGCVRSGEIPSMVVIFFPSARETGATQERTASPSMWTVQAPHCAIPHPYLVPVSLSESRITQSSGVEGGSATLTAFPLTVNEIKRCLLAFLADRDAKACRLKNGAPHSARQTHAKGALNQRQDYVTEVISLQPGVPQDLERANRGRRSDYPIDPLLLNVAVCTRELGWQND